MEITSSFYTDYYTQKLIKNIPDPRNSKKNYKSFIIKENRKSVDQSEISTYQRRTFRNPSIVDIKSIITKYIKTLHKLFKSVREAEKVGSNSSLHNDKKVKTF